MDYQETIKHLGGKRFVAMTGAKNFMSDKANNTLTFKIGRNSKKVSWVRVCLTPDDLYAMEFIDAKGIALSEVGDLYADMLEGVFTSNTGMNTHL